MRRREELLVGIHTEVGGRGEKAVKKMEDKGSQIETAKVGGGRAAAIVCLIILTTG